MRVVFIVFIVVVVVAMVVVVFVVVVVVCGGGDGVWIMCQHVWSFETQMLRCWPRIGHK